MAGYVVSNAKMFDEAVCNYSRDFPYIWEELALPIAYSSDRIRAEHILLEVSERYTVRIGNVSQDVLQEMQRRYVVKSTDIITPTDCVFPKGGTLNL